MSVDQGSSQDAQAAAVSALQAGESGNQSDQGSAQQSQSTQAPAPAPAEESSGLANPFLEKVALADRATVEKYVKEWDKGVTQKFQELHGQLEPYQKLGTDHETLGQAMQLMQMIDTEPERVMALLQEAMGQDEKTPQGQEEQQTPAADDPMSSLPPEFVEKFTKIEQVLDMLAGNYLQDQESKTHAQQDEELDKTLTALKEKHGEFDEDYVLAKMSIGVDAEKAVEAYMAAIQGQVNKRSATPQIPAILGGGGAAPQGEGKITDASSSDVKKLVANLLKNSAPT